MAGLGSIGLNAHTHQTIPDTAYLFVWETGMYMFDINQHYNRPFWRRLYCQFTFQFFLYQWAIYEMIQWAL